MMVTARIMHLAFLCIGAAAAGGHRKMLTHPVAEVNFDTHAETLYVCQWQAVVSHH